MPLYYRDGETILGKAEKCKVTRGLAHSGCVRMPLSWGKG